MDRKEVIGSANISIWRRARLSRYFFVNKYRNPVCGPESRKSQQPPEVRLNIFPVKAAMYCCVQQLVGIRLCIFYRNTKQEQDNEYEYMYRNPFVGKQDI